MLQRVAACGLTGCAESQFFLRTFRFVPFQSLIRIFLPPDSVTNNSLSPNKENEMEHGQLLSHVDTDLVTREQLALIETPSPTRSFKPVPHLELIETLQQALRMNHITIRKEQFALRRDGLTLFGAAPRVTARCTPNRKSAAAAAPAITAPAQSMDAPPRNTASQRAATPHSESVPP